MIIIVNGACGVGKSTISKLLSKKLTKCAIIHGDDIHNSIVDAQLISEHIKVTDCNINSMIKNFLQHGFEHIIVDNVYEDIDHLNNTISKMKQSDDIVIPILLYCNLEENIRRDKLRSNEEQCGEIRVAQLYEIFNKIGNDMGIRLDVSNLSKEEVLDKIFKTIFSNSIE